MQIGSAGGLLEVGGGSRVSAKGRREGFERGRNGIAVFDARFKNFSGNIACDTRGLADAAPFGHQSGDIRTRGDKAAFV